MTTTTGSGARSDAGYTLLEILIASALLLVIVSALLAALIALDERVVVDGERGDMMQRSRAAVDALALDLAAAGGAAVPRRDAPPIVALMPAVYPRRVGLRSADGADVFRTDAITVFAASPLPAIGTTLAQDTPARTTATRVAPGPGCPPADPLCAIAAGSDLLVADERGGFDLFTVTALAPPFIELRHHGGDGPALYPAGSLAVPVEGRTYYLRAAGSARPSQLVRYAGGEAFDTPVVDHVVSLGFEYVGVADPPRMSRALSDPWGVRTTYGPAPPVADATVVPVLAGGNCVFDANGTPFATPRLPALGPPGTLVRLEPATFVDGPWCPDDLAPQRYDADLLRIRSVRVTLVVSSALAALRGPAGTLFALGGTATVARRFAPDVRLEWRITPPALAGL